jgi:hypothetical protein
LADEDRRRGCSACAHSWRRAPETWGLRLGPDPRCIVATTPRPINSSARSSPRSRPSRRGPRPMPTAPTSRRPSLRTSSRPMRAPASVAAMIGRSKEACDTRQCRRRTGSSCRGAEGRGASSDAAAVRRCRGDPRCGSACFMRIGSIATRHRRPPTATCLCVKTIRQRVQAPLRPHLHVAVGVVRSAISRGVVQRQPLLQVPKLHTESVRQSSAEAAIVLGDEANLDLPLVRVDRQQLVET